MNNHYIIDLLEEMKHNCLNGNNYDDPKRNDKAEALNYAIFCVKRQQPTVDAEPVRMQKPLTLEEAADSEEPCVYIENKGVKEIDAVIIDIKSVRNIKRHILLKIGIDSDESEYLIDERYGKTWRCWATKPTEEERSAAEWE